MNCTGCRSFNTMYDIECGTWFCRSCQFPFSPITFAEPIEYVPASPDDCFAALVEGWDGSIFIAQEKSGDHSILIEIEEEESEEKTAVHLDAEEIKRLIQILELAHATLTCQ